MPLNPPYQGRAVTLLMNKLSFSTGERQVRCWREGFFKVKNTKL